jgi:RimJ/RimL family protein N-acetyltransferase
MSPLFLTTPRLVIRPFASGDLMPIHRLLDMTFGDGSKVGDAAAIEERLSWLQWQILNEVWFAKMFQPLYGDRAVVEQSTGELIGSVGYVPLIGPFDQIPELARTPASNGAFIPEFGLFWAIDPAHQGQGYATEAAQAMIAYAFDTLNLRRIIAMTHDDNLASQAVMRKAGMTLTRNPLPEPPWLQVVGFALNAKAVD